MRNACLDPAAAVLLMIAAGWLHRWVAAGQWVIAENPLLGERLGAARTLLYRCRTPAQWADGKGGTRERSVLRELDHA